MLKNTEADHPDFEALTKLAKNIENIVAEINESKRVKDNLFKLEEVADRLDVAEVISPNI